VQVRLLGSGGFAPSDRRETASALVTRDNGALLIDAGTGVRRLLTDRSLLDGIDRLHVVLTHFHLDHVIGLFYIGAVGVPVEVWGAGEALERMPTAALVERLLAPPFAPPSFLGRLDQVNELAVGKDTPIGAFRVRARVQERHSNPTLALRVDDAMVWCTDTEYDEGNIAFAQGSRVLFHETFANERTHTAAEDAGRLAAAAGVDSLVLIHINPVEADEVGLVARARSKFDDVQLGEDGLVVAV
jgi:ribonuclease BN (tRNA processing enzyme)